MASVEFSINASRTLFFYSSSRIRACRPRIVSRSDPADIRFCSIYGTLLFISCPYSTNFSHISPFFHCIIHDFFVFSLTNMTITQFSLLCKFRIWIIFQIWCSIFGSTVAVFLTIFLLNPLSATQRMHFSPN